MNGKLYQSRSAHRTRPNRTLSLAVLLCLTTTLLMLPPSASRAASTPAPDLATQLDAYLTGLSAQSKFSGSVLVARQSTVPLSKGYGLADREHKVASTSDTPYQVVGMGGSISALSVLWLEDHHLLADQTPICTFLPHCPATWRPITVHMVLDGTSGLPGFDTTTPGQTAAQSLAILQSEPLDHTPGALVSYDNGTPLVLSLITEKVSGQAYGAFIRHAFLDPAGMAHSGWLTPKGAPRTLAQSYSGSAHNDTAVTETSSFFPIYATTADVYAYDNALFGGRLVSRHSLDRLFTPRAPDPNAPTGFVQARLGYLWSSAQVARHRAIYIMRSDRHMAANLRFVQDGVTIVVLGNDDQDNVGDIARHLAGIVFAERLAAPTPVPVAPLPAPLLGSYRRTFQNADRIAARDPGLTDWVGGTITLTIGPDAIHFALMDNKPQDSVDEYYTATADGRLTMGGYLPINHNSFCSDNPHADPPAATYRWAHHGNLLTISRIAFDPCLDRGAALPGTWTKIG